MQIPGDLWIDGSFLTEKLNPADVDLVLRLKGEAFQRLDPKQKAKIKWFAEESNDPPHYCDSYVFMYYEANHPLHQEGQQREQYWRRQFGFSRADQPKGMAVLNVRHCCVSNG